MARLNYILIVDDDEASNLITRLFLEKADVTDQIHVRMNGVEAVAFIMQHMNALPELILLDINMPLMDGFEFLRRWKANGMTGKSKIVMYTSSGREADIAHAKQYEDVVAYIEKPMSMAKINQLLDAVFGQNRSGS
ncbi:response regulator [Cytophagaceae bacterium DM2B3-1]|uniref:Response regulator n=1 Tax=Xanthocytophaga flava TaxID=3048013 RepID=A0AAE3QWK1_9BACT|nr:response regulator [Xanthocytophaga flavus]MDJ1471418.1 response regulator [Xanthocytophaga flavus]MDJ1484723.1 response regulator [Xanthocytophaga flavus]MDJ1496707.1 response regulator [Xanthocytophaga flavus]